MMRVKHHYEENAGMTKPENVRSKMIPTRNCKEETSGVATQKEIIKDRKKVKILVDVLYDLLKIYGYSDRKGRAITNCLDPQQKLKLIKANKAATANDKLRLELLYLTYVDKAGIGSWKDLFKYKINAYFSWVMKQDLPPAPKGLEEIPKLMEPSFLYFGRAKRFLGLKISTDHKKLESFAQSVAQSKKGAPPVSEDMVLEAEIKCFKHLTTPRADIPDFTLYDNVEEFPFEYPINRNTACFQLRRTMREIFRKKVPLWKDITKPFVPSTNSQYNFSRNGLGGVGAFKNNDTLQKIISEAYEGKETLIQKKLGSVQLSDELTEFYGKAGREDQWRIDNHFENVVVKDTIGLIFDGSELLDVWSDQIYPKMIGEAIKEQPRTLVIGLPEPLKVRCITAGPPITYAVLKPFQKWLWRTLKNESVFQLIGTPVTQDIVMKQLGKLGFDEEFISGDYKASTDNLHSWVSECLLDELDKIWTEELTQKEDNDPFYYFKDHIVTLMKRALTGHQILNPERNASYREHGESSGKGESGVSDDDFSLQQEGQLMGSIISFPFLCLANAAFCRWAMEISDFKNYKLVDRTIEGYETCRLLINGDDCVFPGKTRRCFSIWQKITAFGGLESSVGKTFRSREFMTINSVQYQYDKFIKTGWEEESGSFVDPLYQDVKYVNLGLVYGQKKDGIRGKPFYSLGAVHRDLHRTCPEELFLKATKQFMKNCSQTRYRSHLVKKDGKLIKIKVEDFFANIRNSKVPYYMPEWLGGLGLVRTKKDQINDWDLKVASCLRSGQTDHKIAKITKGSLWEFHGIVSDYLSDYQFLADQNFLNVTHKGEQRDLEKEYTELYTQCVVDRLLVLRAEPQFDSTGQKLPGLIKSILELKYDEKRLRECHFQNMKIWEALRCNPKFNGLIASQRLPDFEDLLQERKDFTLSCFNIGKKEE